MPVARRHGATTKTPLRRMGETQRMLLLEIIIQRDITRQLQGSLLVACFKLINTCI